MNPRREGDRISVRMVEKVDASRNYHQELSERFERERSSKKTTEYEVMYQVLLESLCFNSDTILESIVQKYGYKDVTAYRMAVTMDVAPEDVPTERQEAEHEMSQYFHETLSSIHREFTETMVNVNKLHQKTAEFIQRYAKVLVEIKREASVDKMTGLVRDEQATLERIRADLEYSMELGLEDTVVVLIDLDHFKRMNEDPRITHRGADKTLVAFARALLDGLRSDFVGRVHDKGDEFIVVLKNVSAQDINSVLERLLREVINKISILDKDGNPTSEFLGATLGVGVITSEEAKEALTNPNNFEVLISTKLHQAEAALNLGKANGRNKYEVYTSATEQSLQQNQEQYVQRLVEGAERSLEAFFGAIKQQNPDVERDLRDSVTALLQKSAQQAFNKQ